MHDIGQGVVAGPEIYKGGSPYFVMNDTVEPHPAPAI